MAEENNTAFPGKIVALMVLKLLMVVVIAGLVVYLSL
jgi:hypothetical protein